MKSESVSNALKIFVEFGNVSVTVIVTNNENDIVNPLPCPLDAFEIAHLFQVALENNPYFEQVVVQPQLPGGANVVFPVFAAQVIQFLMMIFQIYVKHLLVLLQMYFMM